MTYNFERADMNDQNCIPATSEIILLGKKWFWYNKLKLEIDNDGIHTELCDWEEICSVKG